MIMEHFGAGIMNMVEVHAQKKTQNEQTLKKKKKKKLNQTCPLFYILQFWHPGSLSTCFWQVLLGFFFAVYLKKSELILENDWRNKFSRWTWYVLKHWKGPLYEDNPVIFFAKEVWFMVTSAKKVSFFTLISVFVCLPAECLDTWSTHYSDIWWTHSSQRTVSAADQEFPPRENYSFSAITMQLMKIKAWFQIHREVFMMGKSVLSDSWAVTGS